MTDQKQIQRALISVFYKDGLAPIVEKLHANNVEILSTGGTLAFINELGMGMVKAAEGLEGRRCLVMKASSSAALREGPK